MPTTLAQLAELVGGRLTPDNAAQLPIRGAATLEVVEAGEITLADHADRLGVWAHGPA